MADIKITKIASISISSKATMTLLQRKFKTNNFIQVLFIIS